MFKKFNKNKYLISISVIFIGLFSFISLKCVASIDINLNVSGCNNNNICEPTDENHLNCPNDCTPCNYNGVCELQKGETSESCSSDCHHRRVPSIEGGYGGSIEQVYDIIGDILNLNIKTGINYAIISWDTVVPALGSISWGVKDSYNAGVINGISIETHHEMTIENLSASTTYSYSIESSLQTNYYASNLGIFTTAPIPEIKIIPSIYNLIATPTQNEIIFNWNNPEGKDFYGVRIVRSPFFFPADPLEGKIIYDGRGSYARDSDIELDKKYYYTAFSYNKDLDFSSGVLVEGFLKSKQVVGAGKVSEDLSKQTTGVARGKEDLYKVASSSKEIIGGEVKSLGQGILPINNFVFIEGDTEFAVSSGTIKVYPFTDSKIIIDVNILPPQTKILILKIQDPSNVFKIFSYSFSLDPTRKVYYVVIPKLGNNIYHFSIASYGLDNKEVSLTNGLFDIKAAEEKGPQSPFGPTLTFFNKLWITFVGILKKLLNL